MQIQQNHNNISFKQVFVKSKDAEKLLKKADRAIKASNVTFLDAGIPEGHKKPLWSVLQNVLQHRQASNPNHIIIEVSDKSNQLLCVKTLDNKGFTTTKIDVSPMPEFGTKNELFPTSDMKRTFWQNRDTNIYGKSNFFNVMDIAEYEADMLLEEQLKYSTTKSLSLKMRPKENHKPKDASLILNPKRIEKARMKIVEHAQKPFENFKKLLREAIKNESTEKNLPKKTRLPRTLKKELKKRGNT